MASVKGKLFEFFVYKLLLSCGFKQVAKDGLLIYDGGPGTMIQGLGQTHNADVLLEPPFQTPFYFSTRLLIECKCYDEAIGLPVIRNALGLREDINNFDIVTEEILQNRKLVYTTKNICYPKKRYLYQVAVASYSGFKSTAITYAQAHRIPLISFSESRIFENIRSTILEVERRAKDNSEYERAVLQCLKQDSSQLQAYGIEEDREYRNFYREVENLQERMAIGLLEDGTLLFMIMQEDIPVGRENNYDGCEIHWENETSAWELYDGQKVYSFELPKEIYREWIESAEERRKKAIQIKEEFFSKIILFEKNSWRESNVKVLHLSERFLETAKRELDENFSENGNGEYD